MTTAALIGSIISILGLVAKILADAKGLLPNKATDVKRPVLTVTDLTTRPSDPPQ